MLTVDLPVVTRTGDTELLSPEGDAGPLGIQTVADELHASARRLRLFSAAPVQIDAEAVLQLVERTAADVGDGLAAGAALLG